MAGSSRATRAFITAALTAWLLLGAGAASADEVNDPWEGMNRGIFWFNERVDMYFLEPVAKGWDFVLPDPIQRSLRRVMDNARFPVIFVNDLLQAKPYAAIEDLARFVMNSTLGAGGLFDPASTIGWDGHNEDFGQTLGYWGVPAGPYLVIPFLGPSNPRDAVGLAADSAARVYPYFVVFWISSAVTGTDLLNRRSLLIDEIANERESALDFYAAVRNAYSTRRENLVHDREDTPEDTTTDLYYFEDEE